MDSVSLPPVDKDINWLKHEWKNEEKYKVRRYEKEGETVPNSKIWGCFDCDSKWKGFHKANQNN